MFKKNLTTSLLCWLFFFSLFFIYNFSLAEGALAQGLIPKSSSNVATCSASDPTYCGDYKLNDFVTLAVTISQLILGLVGSLSLIMFVYGGVMFLISAGSSDKIAQAKKIIVAAVVGLLIVFSSWLIIKFVTDSLGAKQGFTGKVEITK